MAGDPQQFDLKAAYSIALETNEPSLTEGADITRIEAAPADDRQPIASYSEPETKEPSPPDEAIRAELGPGGEPLQPTLAMALAGSIHHHPRLRADAQGRDGRAANAPAPSAGSRLRADERRRSRGVGARPHRLPPATKGSRSIRTTLLSAICDEHDRHCVCHLQQGPCRRAATCKDHIRRKRDHFRRVLA